MSLTYMKLWDRCRKFTDARARRDADLVGSRLRELRNPPVGGWLQIRPDPSPYLLPAAPNARRFVQSSIRRAAP